MNESLRQYEQGFSDPNKIIFCPENLEYVLRIHGGLSLDEIKKMPLLKGMRFAIRILHDMTIMRPDTYLAPLAEILPGIMAETQAKSEDMIKNLKVDMRKATFRKMQTKAHPYQFTFPKTWVN